jgi:hypothetical protein
MEKQCITLTFADLTQEIKSNLQIGVNTELIHHPEIISPPQSEWWDGNICCYVYWDNDILHNFNTSGIQFYIFLDEYSIDWDALNRNIDEFVADGGQFTGGTTTGISDYIKISINSNTPPSWFDKEEIIGIGKDTNEVIIFEGEGPWSLSHPVRRMKVSTTLFTKAYFSKTGYHAHYNGGDYHQLVTRNGKEFTKRKKWKKILGAAQIEYEIGGNVHFGHTSFFTFQNQFLDSSIISSLQYNYIAISNEYDILGKGTFSFSGETEWGPIPACASGV